MKRAASAAAIISLAVFSLACTDNADRSTLSPNADILDALQGGNQHFVFLPPLAPTPNAANAFRKAGRFDPHLSPEVRICAWEATRCALDATGGELLVAHYTDQIRVIADREAYSVVWQTRGAGLRDGAVYRIRVLVGGAELGYADVLVGGNRSIARGVDVRRYHVLTNGAALPIAFRIEQGAVYVAPAAGGTLVTNDGAATIEVPAGAVPSDVGLTVFPSETPPTNPRFVPGTAFDFGPDGTTFTTPVTLNLRYDPAAVPPGMESTLRLVQIVGTQLITVPGSSVNTTTHTVSGAVSHFSEFGIASVTAATVDVTPTSLTLNVDEESDLLVTVRDADGNVLTDRELIISTTIDGIVQADLVAETQNVHVRALTAGSTELTVTADGVSSSPVAITATAAGPSSITIQRSGTDFYPPELGARLQYTATPRDAMGNEMAGEIVTWQVQSPGGAVVTGGIADNVIEVDLVALGSGTLMASIGAVSAMEMILVSPQMIQQVQLSPLNSNIEVGDRTTISATAVDIRGKEVSISSTSWMINGSAVSNDGTVGAAGNFVALRGVSAGFVNISANVMGQFGSFGSSSMMAAVNVANESNSCPPPGPCFGQQVAAISGVPLAIELRVGESTTFSATAVDAASTAVSGMMPTVLFFGANGVATFSWSGSDATANVMITGAAPGTMTLQVTAGWITYTLPVVVKP